MVWIFSAAVVLAVGCGSNPEGGGGSGGSGASAGSGGGSGGGGGSGSGGGGGGGGFSGAAGVALAAYVNALCDAVESCAADYGRLTPDLAACINTVDDGPRALADTGFFAADVAAFDACTAT
jgi:hypothetical protein